MNKITNSEIQKYHVQSVTGNRLTGTVEQNKRVFDNFPQFVADRINEIIDELTGTGGAGSISTTGGTLQSVLDSYLASINDRYTKDATNTLVTAETKDLVKSVAVDINTGVITVTKKDGTATTIDTAIEKIPATFSLENDDATGKASLVVTNQDGSVTRTDVSNLLNHYTFDNTGLINFTAVKSSDGYHITAVVNDASVGMAQLNAEVTDYINGVKAAVALSEANAKTSETNAKTSETNASASASKAQSYAVGGTGTRTGEDSDNAKYYAEQASNSASSAESSASSATSSATSAATSAASAEKTYQDVKDIAALSDIAEIKSQLVGKADKATTLSGYGISDSYNKSEIDTKLTGKADKATTLSGYGITDAYTKTETYTKEEVDAALEDKANHKYNQNANVLGVTKTTEQIGDEQAVFKKGGIFGGTAAEAGLVTRGICGITSPDENGGCTKENLYINYDGGTEYKSDRQMVLQAGNVGAHYGHNLYQYAAARGDAVKGYVDNATVASAQKATNDSDGNAINTTYRKISDSYSKSETDTKLTGKADKATSLSGYGITDGVTTSGLNTAINGFKRITWSTITIATSAWSNNTATVSVSGVTASNAVDVAPVEPTFDAYINAGIRATSQDSGTLTFACKTVPTVAISVNVKVYN